MLRNIRMVIVAVLLSASGFGAVPPITFLDEGGTRFITIETLEGGKVAVELRTVGAPGSYGRWAATGLQTVKGIEFSQKVEEDAPAGPVYLATGGQSKLTVKLKPGQAGVQDAGLSGVFHHISAEKLNSLAKKDFEAAEKKLDETIKMASHKAPAEDKLAYVEWKKAWPGLRDRLIALTVPKAAVPAPAAPPARLGAGQPVGAPPEKQAVAWMQRAETTAAGVNFIGGGVPLGLKSGWEGIYEDGFGGSIEIFVVSNGDARFNLTSARGPDGSGGNIEGGVPAKTIKTAKDGTSSGEFTEKNSQLKDGELPTQFHFRRIGHFLVIESLYAERYAGRGWFDGIYLKRPQPVEGVNQ